MKIKKKIKNKKIKNEKVLSGSKYFFWKGSSQQKFITNLLWLLLLLQAKLKFFLKTFLLKSAKACKMCCCRKPTDLLKDPIVFSKF